MRGLVRYVGESHSDGVALGTLIVAVALAFPASSDHVFRNAPLQVVLTQVRFPPILSLVAEPGAAGFQEAIREGYPRMTKVEEAGLMLGPSGMQAQRQAPAWKFADADEKWIVSLSVDFVAFETPAYTNADDFLDRFDHVLDAIDRTVHPAASTRVGLRKVNQLTADIPDVAAWRELLNPGLVGLLGEPAMPGEVLSSFSDLRLRDENGDVLAIRHGLLDDTPAIYRIDLDYFTERPLQVAAGGDLTNLLRQYARSETEFFVWSLRDELYERYGPVPRPKRREDLG